MVNDGCEWFDGWWWLKIVHQWWLKKVDEDRLWRRWWRLMKIADRLIIDDSWWWLNLTHMCTHMQHMVCVTSCVRAWASKSRFWRNLGCAEESSGIAGWTVSFTHPYGSIAIKWMHSMAERRNCAFVGWVSGLIWLIESKYFVWCIDV